VFQHAIHLGAFGCSTYVAERCSRFIEGFFRVPEGAMGGRAISVAEAFLRRDNEGGARLECKPRRGQRSVFTGKRDDSVHGVCLKHRRPDQNPLASRDRVHGLSKKKAAGFYPDGFPAYSCSAS
jgi:hypothetical protein